MVERERLIVSIDPGSVNDFVAFVHNRFQGTTISTPDGLEIQPEGRSWNNEKEELRGLYKKIVKGITNTDPNTISAFSNLYEKSLEQSIQYRFEEITDLTFADFSIHTLNIFKSSIEHALSLEERPASPNNTQGRNLIYRTSGQGKINARELRVLAYGYGLDGGEPRNYEQLAKMENLINIESTFYTSETHFFSALRNAIFEGKKSS